jgi:FAD/FMN-containing dehydrogenase
VTGYADRKARLLAELAAGGRAGTRVGLAKNTSNLFRDRAPRARPAIDLKRFDHVLAVDAAAGVVESEGMVRYVDLADATLAHGVMPAVVPQLKSITLGGAVAGVGIEATSFRHGLVHDTIAALDVVTGDGRIVTCTPENEHRDLFFGIPNSYGTLGYALKLSARTLRVKPYVQIEHLRYTDAAACFADVAHYVHERDGDFLDGVVFAPGELYLTRGTFVDSAPYTSDYSYERI